MIEYNETKIIKINSEISKIKKAAKILRKCGLVAFPIETGVRPLGDTLSWLF